MGIKCPRRPLKPSFHLLRPFNLSGLILLIIKGREIRKARMQQKEVRAPWPRRLSPREEPNRLG